MNNNKKRIVKGKLVITIEFEDDFPKTWDKETIQQFVRMNKDNYMNGKKKLEEVRIESEV